MNIPFIKLHGLGNDFMVVDARKGAAHGPAPLSWLSPETISKLAHRQGGIGFDQLVVVEDMPPNSSIRGDYYVRFYNQDGSQSLACGNGTRALAAWLMGPDQTHLTLATAERALDCTRIDGKAGPSFFPTIQVDMGAPLLGWQDIPLAQDVGDSLALPLALPKALKALFPAVGVGMGNPHAVIIVDNVDKLDLARFGPDLEHDKLFPNRANIGFISHIKDDQWRLRVWERGAGLTLACGTGAAAAIVALNRLGLVQRSQTPNIQLLVDGSFIFADQNGAPAPLYGCWQPDSDTGMPRGALGHILLAGPAATSFYGHVEIGG